MAPILEKTTAGRSAQRGSVLDRLLIGVQFILRSGEVSEKRFSGESVHACTKRLVCLTDTWSFIYEKGGDERTFA